MVSLDGEQPSGECATSDPAVSLRFSLGGRRRVPSHVLLISRVEASCRLLRLAGHLSASAVFAADSEPAARMAPDDLQYVRP